MPNFYVRCEPATIEGEFEADDAECAIDAAMDDWCETLGPATDAITSGSFSVTELPA